jgi:photosystem II stability/assembly factor-like uncharacterized protein
LSKKQRAARPSPHRGSRRATLTVAAIAVAGGVLAVAAVLTAPGPIAQTSWARLGTEDVHSLAFVGDDLDHLLFGHHGGLSESRDGGRTWRALPTTADAMAMRPGADGSIVIAGHEVFTASQDGGQTWQPIAADLPSLDIHGFTRDPVDPARMWAYLATGGLWESTDAGARWTRVREDNVLFPVAVRGGAGTRLFGVDGNGLVASDDGGRTWETIVAPPTYPMTALAATMDGVTLYAGSPDGLFRSGDAGRTWTTTTFNGSPFAIATATDGRTVAVVARTTEFFRSSDGGASWPGPN